MLPGFQGSNAHELTAMGSTLYFSASIAQPFDNELWRSDGTTAGTALLKDIAPTGGSFPTYLTVIGSTLYFNAINNVNDYELWKNDGTAAGTIQVKDINTGAASSNPAYLREADKT